MADVAQPLNSYFALVGTVLDSVSVSPYHFVCADGAPEPPLALYDTVYDAFFDTVKVFFAVDVCPLVVMDKS